jgi:glyoxylase-like metal-dependent hydrolase (beta-lactamase superfamily II)
MLLNFIRLTRSCRAFFAIVILAVALFAAFPAEAKAALPLSGSYVAEGVYKLELGDLTIYSFADRSDRLDFTIIENFSPDQIKALVGPNPEMDDNSLTSYVSVFLVKDKNQSGLYLIDTGYGVGGVLENGLKAAGFSPDDVTDVFLTHYHGDHVNGLTDDSGRPRFPKATVHGAEAEDKYWLKDGAGGRGQGAESKIGPYDKAGLYKTFKPYDELKPGVTALELYGHTPGHVGFLFKSGAGEFLAFGDVVHAYLVQFKRPDVTVTYDVDSKAAAASRALIFERAAKGDYLVAGAHLPFPALGRISKEGEGKDAKYVFDKAK